MSDKSAIFSKCGKYRYSLSRIWMPVRGIVCFVGLNPSIADDKIDDPTIRRCIGYAKSWGYGGLFMVNLYGFRATKPKDMYKATDPVGKDNDYFVNLQSGLAQLTILAWGAISDTNRIKSVLSLIEDPHCIALTKKGQPRHPLYLKKDLEPKPYKLGYQG